MSRDFKRNPQTTAAPQTQLLPANFTEPQTDSDIVELGNLRLVGLIIPALGIPATTISILAAPKPDITPTALLDQAGNAVEVTATPGANIRFTKDTSTPLLYDNRIQLQTGLPTTANATIQLVCAPA